MSTRCAGGDGETVAPGLGPRSLQTLLEVGSEQGGYVTAQQAVRLGVERSRLSRLQGSGDLRGVRWGVYAMRHAHHRFEDEIGAWLSVDRERMPWERDEEAVAVLSHTSAAALHDLGTIIPEIPALTVPARHRSASRGAGIELHVAPLVQQDWLWFRAEDISLPVTTPARTIVDLLVAGEEASYVTRGTAEALADQRTTAEEIIETARRRRRRNETLVRRTTQLLESVSHE